jgi:putative ABC transport system substrate-binding protein
MDRRAFLSGFTLGLPAAPLAADAQPAGQVPRVGVLAPSNPPPGDAFRQREWFEAGLRELGWRSGSNIVVDYRYAEGKLARLPALAVELVRIPVDVIVARGLPQRQVLLLSGYAVFFTFVFLAIFGTFSTT